MNCEAPVNETQQKASVCEDDGASLIIKGDMSFNFLWNINTRRVKILIWNRSDQRSFWSASPWRSQAQDFLDGLFVLAHGVLVVAIIL